MSNTQSRLIRVGSVLAVLLALPFSAAAEDPLDREFDLYWGEKRDVANIHKRLFMKDGRHEFTLMVGVIPNDDFFSYIPLSLRYDYYFSEDFAVEVSGAYLFKQNSDLENFLENDLDIDGLGVLLPQFLQWQAGAGILWTPIYGKFGAFATKLAHFDFGLAFGVMAIGTQIQAEAKSGEVQGVSPDTAYSARTDVGGNVGATVRFFILDFMAIRIDYRHYFYAARDADDETSGVSYPAEISLGLSFWTPERN